MKDYKVPDIEAKIKQKNPNFANKAQEFIFTEKDLEPQLIALSLVVNDGDQKRTLRHQIFHKDAF